MNEAIFGLVIGLLAGAGGSIAGGGFGGIVILLLSAMGYPTAVSIGTMKVGVLGTISGSFNQFRGKKLIQVELLKYLIPISILATIVGPMIALSLDEAVLSIMVAIFVIVTALIAMFGSARVKGIKVHKTSRRSRIIGYITYFLTVVILAGFGSGISLLINYILIGFFGMTALENLATRRATAMIAGPVQAIVFAVTGNVVFVLAGGIAVGTFIGATYGTKLAIAKGNSFVSKVIALIAIIMSIWTILAHV